MDYRVISADDHIDLRWLPKDLWTQRLPANLRDRGPHVAETDKGALWICDGELWGTWGAYTAAQGSGAKWALERGGVMREGELRPTVPEMRLEDMDRDGVDASVMYGPTDPLNVADPELRRACYRAYNDWLVDFCAAKPDRLIGVGHLSLEDPEFAREELERMAKQGVRHFNILAARANPPVYNKRWEPFWSLAEETGIPIGFHLCVVVKRTRPESAENEDPWVAAATNVAANHQGFQLIAPITGLIFTGMLDRHPKLKLVMAEAGLAWVPNMIQSLDTHCRRLKEGRRLIGKEGDAQHLPEMMPSEYFPRNIWITFEDDPAGVKMLGLLDENRVMWASDYPHPASTWPYSQQVIENQMHGVPEGVQQKILNGNARALYGL